MSLERRPIASTSIGMVLLGICVPALGGDSRLISITVETDGKSCVVQNHRATCSDLPRVLAEELKVPKTETVSVSSAGCGKAANHQASAAAEILKKAGFDRIIVIGFLSEPNKECPG